MRVQTDVSAQQVLLVPLFSYSNRLIVYYYNINIYYDVYLFIEIKVFCMLMLESGEVYDVELHNYV